MATIPTKDRAYAAAHFALELDSQHTGLIRSIEGGGVKAEVMTYQHGGGYDRWRQLGKPKFEDFKLQVGMSMGPMFYDWIKRFFTGNQDRRAGAILAGDFEFNERARREFKFALIREVTLPALDGSGSKEVSMGISIACESMEFKPGSGQKLPHEAEPEAAKRWKQCDFRLNLAGFDLKRVSKVDACTIKQNIIEYHSGGSRTATKTPSQIEFPNLSFVISESDALPLIERFMKRGGAIKPLSYAPIPDGSLEYRGSDGKTLATLKFHNSEIINIQPDKSDSTTDNIKTVKIDLSVESMEFEYT